MTMILFLEIPHGFATILWGEQLPYGQSVKIVDGDNLWVVKIKRNVLGPVFCDGFTKVVRERGLKKNDHMLFKAFGPSTLYLSIFKGCVFENSFITKIRADDASFSW